MPWIVYTHPGGCPTDQHTAFGVFKPGVPVNAAPFVADDLVGRKDPETGRWRGNKGFSYCAAPEAPALPAPPALPPDPEPQIEDLAPELHNPETLPQE